MLFRRQRFCLCVASTSPPDGHSGNLPASGGLESDVRRLFAGVSEGLQAAGLAPRDAASIQLYVSKRCCEGGGLSAIIDAVESALAGSDWEGFPPAVVPVSAVGPTQEADAGLLLHVLFVRSQVTED